MSSSQSGLWWWLITNPGESRQANIIANAAITWVIGAIFVGLRVYARRVLLRNALGVEDWLIIVALVFSALTCAGEIERESLVRISMLARAWRC